MLRVIYKIQISKMKIVIGNCQILVSGTKEQWPQKCKPFWLASPALI